jgi:hypothetical protein
MRTIYLPNKKIRAKLIKKYLNKDKCFCFSCGNAIRELRKAKVNVIGVSKKDLISANREISPFEAKELFGCFDATSGNLPLSLLPLLAEEIKKFIPKECLKGNDKVVVPVGSGETIFALMWLFQADRLLGVYGDYSPIKFNITPLKAFIVNNVQTLDIGKISKIGDIPKKLSLKGVWFVNTEDGKTTKEN